jgi:plastocyanin
MKNVKAIFVIALVAFIAIGAFLLLGNSSKSPAQQASSPEGTVTNGVREFKVAGFEYGFSPSEMKVKQGEKVKITFTNNQGVHDLRISGYETGTEILTEGKTETFEFIADKAGEFEYFCSVGDHQQQGMTGKLVVE